MNSAYSAVASVPGAYVPGNQTGYYQTVVIRGGDYDQVGYEFDGVPVNRSFDNYPSSSASSLGNSEVQVYTGATPANSQGQGLAGYINQVIRTGTYPGFADGQLGIATPAFYHRAMVEAGGATPDRLFSYYVGVAGYNQAFNYLDNQNGSSYDNWVGAPMCVTAATSATLPTFNIDTARPRVSTITSWARSTTALLSAISARDTVVNLHFAIPHQNDGGRDDVQVLWDSESLHNTFYSNTSDITSTHRLRRSHDRRGMCGAIGIEGIGAPPSTSIASTTTARATSARRLRPPSFNAQNKCVGTYYFPSSTNRTSPGQPIIRRRHGLEQPGDRETAVHAQLRLVGLRARVRLHVLLATGSRTVRRACTRTIAGCCSADYELSSHTRGVSMQFQDQINSQNLVSLSEDYTTANSVRDNNSFYSVGPAAVVVNAAAPTSGYCYGTDRRRARSTATGTSRSFGTISEAGALRRRSRRRVRIRRSPRRSARTCLPRTATTPRTIRSSRSSVRVR